MLELLTNYEIILNKIMEKAGIAFAIPAFPKKDRYKTKYKFLRNELILVSGIS